LPSREDPFPLVCLEAAAFEKPILCFENAGGMPEFVEEDAGFVVPYLDVEVMCQRVAQLHDDPQLLSQLGQVAANKVRNRHDVSQGGAEILKIVDGFHRK
jgi:glycosyltransferase involved in cell wall biosynthesis